ncbi:MULTISPECIES: YidC/Oxa1 family membrane protein insertase [unclassified Paenibacillus]|uniref:YidC/Oxa1 family membrane protein insertase n=1 Tax=unclassified Paenibacillus TaxID=185978 RepID=UPI001C0F70D8|nr:MULTISPECIES: YidC/Oxa1 family membrane protein insertase [unclassified Paenibacillus]MBU5441962.1 YidC/Oxa1 family membrane protein insertase [Paenibacillus sp. MSJ-34]CAH0121877.1 Membrane protein insertase YidC 2 [Paenibacillus sp. CECT 9249]
MFLDKQRNRKWILIIALVVLAAVALAGCTPTTTTTTTEDMKQGGFWQANVVYYFSLALDTFAKWFGGEYGLSILLLTIIVRLIILPLTIKQVRSSKAMQAIQPEIKKLQDKYKNDQQKLQEETMKLFQKHQVNPLAGCLPLVVQMPIFIALYNAIYMNSEIRDHTFLWMQLGTPDHLFILPVIAAITTFIQSKMMPTQATGPMQVMFFIFPVLIFIMSMQFPAALPLYWVYSNIFTIVQNYFLYRKGSNDKEVLPAK